MRFVLETPRGAPGCRPPTRSRPAGAHRPDPLRRAGGGGAAGPRADRRHGPSTDQPPPVQRYAGRGERAATAVPGRGSRRRHPAPGAGSRAAQRARRAGRGVRTERRWPTRPSAPSWGVDRRPPPTVPTASRCSPARGRPRRTGGCCATSPAAPGPTRYRGKDVEDEPLIAVLTAPLTGLEGDVQAGEALQRVLLTATSDGLAVSYVSQLIEVPDARGAVHHLLGTLRPPHVVLRIGHGWPTPRVPRRAVSDMLLDSPATTPRPDATAAAVSPAARRGHGGVATSVTAPPHRTSTCWTGRTGPGCRTSALKRQPSTRTGAT